MSLAQNHKLVIHDGATFNGNGIITVKDSIRNSNSSLMTNITGKVVLSGAAQGIVANAANGSLRFDTLSIRGSVTKTITGTITVSDSLNILSGITLNISGDTLRIGKDVANAGNPFTTNSNTVIEYINNSSASQSILGGTFSGKLRLTGNTRKNLQNTLTVDSLEHSGWALTVNNNLTINGKSIIDSILDIAVTRTLQLGSQASTIANLNNNSGIITCGSGAISFTNAASNAGTITGGTGIVTFNNTLTHTAGSITAGTSGTILFSGAVTGSATASIAATGAGDSLRFASTLNLNGSSTLNLTNGRVRFDSTIVLAGSNFNLGSSSWTYFNGLSQQTIPVDTFGNVYITNRSRHNPDGNVFVTGSIQLDSGIVMGVNTLTILSAASNVSGVSEIIGAVKRQHNFTANTLYSFNRSETGLALNQDESTSGAAITISMTPNSDPTSASGSYAKRQYTFASSNLAATDSIRKAQLFFLDSEIQGGVAASKMGIRTYSGSAWTKLTNPSGSYYRNVTSASPNNSVLDSMVAGSLSSVTELGIFKTNFVTNKNSAVWSNGSAWDENNVPQNTDEVVIANTGVSVSAAGAVADTLIIQSGMDLTVSSGGISVTRGTSSGGILIVNNGTTFSTGGNMTTSALNINGNGSVTVTGSLTTTTALNIANSNGTLTINQGDLNPGGTVTVNGLITVSE